MQAINIVKGKTKSSVADAKLIVDRFIKDNPEIVVFQIPKSRKVIAGVIVGVLAIFIIGIATCEPDKKKEVATTGVESFKANFTSEWDGSCRPVEQLIKQDLNDPESYKHVETKYNFSDSNNIYVLTKFRAKNSFNATITTSAFAYLDWRGNVKQFEIAK